MNKYIMFDSLVDVLSLKDGTDEYFNIIQELCDTSEERKLQEKVKNIPVTDRQVKSNKTKLKKLHITSVHFNYPATVVRWSDKTKTTAIDDKLRKCKHIYGDEESDLLIYTYPEDPLETYHTENLTNWKEAGLTFAIVKKLVPNYFDLLDKWCS